MAAIRLGQWKLISLNNESTFLMDVINDPQEKTNYLTQYPDKVKELQSLLEAWKKKNPKPIWVKTSHEVYANGVLKYWEE